MASTIPAIRPLPTDAIAQIRSSITITSLNGVVIELLKNSLDAQAHKVDVSIDYSRGSCTVEDDGFGIRPAEFKDDGGLGKIHHTSKHDSPDSVHGGSGTFLFSLAALSILQITSRHHQYHSLNSLSINMSRVIVRQTPALAHQSILSLSHGTGVLVRDLFGNIPVRIKQRVDESHRAGRNDKDWEELRKLATGLTLAWPKPVIIIIRDINSNRKIHLRGISKIESGDGLHEDSAFIAYVCRTLSQAMFISSPDPSKWIPVNASTSSVYIHGVISMEPAPSKTVQFISLDIHPLDASAGHNLLYEEINRLFGNSSFGTEVEIVGFNEEERKRGSGISPYSSDGLMKKDLKGAGKGIDRWPMFFIRINSLGPDTYHIEAKNLLDEIGIFNTVLELLQVMILEFLRKHHFRPRYRPKLGSPRNLHSSDIRNVSISNQIHRTREIDRSRAGSQKPTTQRLKASLSIHSGDKSRGSALSSTLKASNVNEIQNQRADSPFNTWSRIKIGKGRLTAAASERPCVPEKEEVRRAFEITGSNDTTNQNCATISTVHTPISELTPSKIGCASSFEEAQDQNRHNWPAITKSGQLNRPPFNDLSPAKLVESNGKRVNKKETLTVLPCEPSGDEGLISWMNPITRKTSIFSSRTGLTVPPVAMSMTASRTKSLHNSVNRQADQDESTLSSHSKTSLWIEDILQNWTNPVFHTVEAPIPKLGLSDPDVATRLVRHRYQPHFSQFEIDRAFQVSSAHLTGRISKVDLRQAQIISQVDKKFILIKLATGGLYVERLYEDSPTETLILVDQHAADERCRIENLLAELCTTPSQDGTLNSTGSQRSGILTSVLQKPLHFIMSKREIDLLDKFSQHFANWGILYELNPRMASKDTQAEQEIIVKSLPPVISEKCRLAPKLLIELLRSEAWKCYERGAGFSDHSQLKDNEKHGANDLHRNGNHAWLKKIQGCPQGILDMLTSRSCRSAIMFNDELSDAKCKTLLARLAECAFPFQCAHGRPSMIPLVNLGILQEERLGKFEDVPSPENFNLAFQSWKKSK